MAGEPTAAEKMWAVVREARRLGAYAPAARPAAHSLKESPMVAYPVAPPARPPLTPPRPHLAHQ